MAFSTHAPSDNFYGFQQVHHRTSDLYAALTESKLASVSTMVWIDLANGNSSDRHSVSRTFESNIAGGALHRATGSSGRQTAWSGRPSKPSHGPQ